MRKSAQEIAEERLDFPLQCLPSSAVLALLAAVSEVDGFGGWWKGRFPEVPGAVGVLREKAIAVSADASARIGWTGIPRGPEPPHAARDRGGHADGGYAAMRDGYAETLRGVLDGYRGAEFGEELIRRIHAGIHRFSREGRRHGGTYRADLVPLPYRARSLEAVALRPADPSLIQPEMAALVRWTQKRLASRAFHPLLVVGVFLLHFQAIRPFEGGNGRTSRALTWHLLLACGYSYAPYASLDRIVAERKAEYYLSLRKSQASLHLPRPDISPWLLSFLQTLVEQVRELREVAWRQPVESTLSGNQRGALALLARHPEISPRLLVAELGIPRDTAKQVLSRLVAVNALERIGSGRAARHRRPGAA